MEELKRLVKLVVDHGAKASPIINYQDEENLETMLFNLIKQGEVQSDEEAALALYNQTALPTSYRMLKSRVRKKLFNHLHFFEFNERTSKPSTIVEFRCNKLLLEAQCMILANEYKIANKVLDQTIELAEAHELNNTILRALEQKQMVYLNLNKPKLYLETKSRLESHYILEEQERIATDLFRRTHLQLSSKLSNRSKYQPKVPAILSEIYTLWEQSRSSSIYNSYHILSVYYLELCGDYVSISDIIANAEALLENGKLHKSWFNYRFNYFVRIYALLRTKQFSLGLTLAEKYIHEFDINSLNRFAFLENHVLLALHCKSYALANKLLYENLNHPLISRIQEPAKERWEIYRRYSLLINQVFPLQSQTEVPRDIFTELVTLPKDKAGFNLSLLVLDIVNSFSSESSDNYESKAERIRKYITKYLRGEKAERPRQLLRLLLIALKHNLDYDETREASENLYNKLSQTAQPGDAFTEVEIIPYEHLWEAILEILRRRNGQ